MIVGAWDHILIGFDVFAENELTTLWTFDPEILWRIPLQERPDLGRTTFEIQFIVSMETFPVGSIFSA